MRRERVERERERERERETDRQRDGQTDRQTEKKRKMEGKTENAPQRKRSRTPVPRTQRNEFPNNAHLIGPELKTLSVCKASDDNNFSWCFCFSK